MLHAVIGNAAVDSDSRWATGRDVRFDNQTCLVHISMEPLMSYESRGKLVLLALTSFVLTIPAQAQFRRGDRQTDRSLSRHTLMHDDRERSFFVRLPQDFEDDERLPVVFALHGGGPSNGATLAGRLDLGPLADRDRFIAVFPNGVNDQWNDGRGKSFGKNADNRDVDDVGFLSSLIEHVVNKYHADSSRIYFTGGSNGGMMTFRIGIELADKVAAIAPMISNIPEKIARAKQPSRRMPVLIMNGTDDPLVPYDGGEVTVFRKTHGRVTSTDDSVDYWRRNNGLSSEPKYRELPDKNSRDGSTIRVHTYGADSDTPVVLYEIRGGGHSIPGMKPRLRSVVGNTNQDIKAAEEIWKFVSQFERTDD